VRLGGGGGTIECTLEQSKSGPDRREYWTKAGYSNAESYRPVVQGGEVSRTKLGRSGKKKTDEFGPKPVIKSEKVSPLKKKCVEGLKVIYSAEKGKGMARAEGGILIGTAAYQNARGGKSKQT